MGWQTKLAAAAGVAALAVMTGAAVVPASAADVTLNMAVPDWPPTHIMKDLFDKEYKAASGNNVKLNLDFIPWPDYYTRLNASLTSGEKKYNMAVSDSPWLGAFIEGGYYLKINKYVDADPGPAGGVQGSAPGGEVVLFDVSVQIRPALRLPADAGSRRLLLSQGYSLRPI